VEEFQKFKLLSSECNLILSVPHIEEAMKHYPPNEYDGELYVHGMDFEDVHSIVGRTTNIHIEFWKMEYHIFDIINEEPQAVRTLELQRLGDYGPIKTVPYHAVENFEGVMNVYNDFLADGYEGMIVRNSGAGYVRKRSTMMLKFKPKKDDYYVIKGYSVQIDKNKEIKPGILGKLICAGSESLDIPSIGEYSPYKPMPDGYFGVGSGFTKEQRETYWATKELLVNQLCHVQYQNITSGKGVPRFPIFMEVLNID
jgi:ATP-dependent DNA ligase